MEVYEQCLRLYPEWTLAQYRQLICEIKRGFAERVMNKLTQLIHKDGDIFNRLILDGETGRGQVQIKSSLSQLWHNMQELIKSERVQLEIVKNDVDNWFLPTDQFRQDVVKRAESLLSITTENYVMYQYILQGRAFLMRNFDKHVRRVARNVKDEFGNIVTRLQHIYDESVWFPFPRIMTDFNNNYNQSVATLNWALRTTFQTSENFKKAQIALEREKERLKRMESRLRFLKVIRDATLFLLSIGQTFLWFEGIGLFFIFILLPLLLVYGGNFGLESLVETVSKQRESVQKILFFSITLFSIVVAGLRTLLRFEQIRAKVLSRVKLQATQARNAALAQKKEAKLKAEKAGKTGKKA